MTRRFVIGPSQLGWLRADCERCFLREVAYKVRRPGGPPDVFNLADAAMKRRFDGSPETMHALGVGPTFSIIAQGLHVESEPLTFAEQGIEIVIKGRLDALVRTNAGEQLVIDYKTTSRKELDPRTYEFQLNAYALALEVPKDRRLQAQVDGLALLVYRPTSFVYRTERCISGLYGTTDWIDVPRNYEKFQALLTRVAALLAEAVQPKANPLCAYCIYYGSLATPIQERAI